MLPLVLAGLLLDILPFHDLEQPTEMASMSILLGFVHWKYRISMKDSLPNKADAHDGK